MHKPIVVLCEYTTILHVVYDAHVVELDSASTYTHSLPYYIMFGSLNIY